jgi:hypothetical protein
MTAMTGENFYLVWREGGGCPTFKHPDYTSAAREAERLARGNPGQEFVVIAPVMGFKKTDVEQIRYETADDLDAEIPF